MPRARGIRVLFSALMLAVAARFVHAQGAGDPVIVRVQRLASDGNAAAGRALADSVLGVAKEGSQAYVDALFARASIAESADAARKDYLRIAVDYSMSPRAEDSLLRLAQMEIARGARSNIRAERRARKARTGLAACCSTRARSCRHALRSPRRRRVLRRPTSSLRTRS